MNYTGKGGWEVVSQLFSEIKLEAIVHAFMYALKEKQNTFEVEYQINMLYILPQFTLL